ncbi:MAG: nucleotide exchange factor GrpE [Nanoarchaeota archaeon]
METTTQPPQQEPTIKETTVEELTSILKYLQAEYENYKKRVERDKADFQKSASRDVIMQLLPVLDTFELALKAMPQEDHLKGFELVYAQFMNILENLDVKQIEASTLFNPLYHEALLQEPSDKPQGTILEELQKGYMLNGKTIRPAKVKIATSKVPHDN